MINFSNAVTRPSARSRRRLSPARPPPNRRDPRLPLLLLLTPVRRHRAGLGAGRGYRSGRPGPEAKEHKNYERQRGCTILFAKSLDPNRGATFPQRNAVSEVSLIELYVDLEVKRDEKSDEVVN